MSDAKHFLQEAIELIKELETYRSYREELLSRSKKLYREYQKGKYKYLEYQLKLKEILKGKTEKEWISYYESCEFGLLKKVEYLLDQSFYLIHKDESFNQLKIQSLRIEEPEKVSRSIRLFSLVPRIRVFDLESELAGIRNALSSLNKPDDEKKIRQLKERLSKHEQKAITGIMSEQATKSPATTAYDIQLKKIRGKTKSLQVNIGSALNRLFKVLKTIAAAVRNTTKAITPLILSLRLWKSSEKQTAAAEKKVTEQASQKAEPSNHFLGNLKQLLFPKKRRVVIEEVVGMEKTVKGGASTPKELAMGWTSSVYSVKEAVIRSIKLMFSKKQETVISENTAVPPYIKKLRDVRQRIYSEERLSGFETTLLSHEAKKIKRILEAQKMQSYSGLTIGIIANITVKKISMHLVEKFPGFFGFLYNALRSANIRMLSNTYLNIMILASLLLTISTTIFLTVLFFILNYPLYQVFLRSIILGFLAGVLCATIFYAYPFIKIKERKRSITTNLPFAINHMASVATSGVPPLTMFELISSSLEYGEVAIELRKIAEYTNILGYDLLTAMRAVSSTTPSPAFKEFLEGMISAIETGGDLISYLKQEADQAALTYQLERQRYNQSISMFSDVYTGLLIAAPLFFVAALALVNILGGKIGGMGVDLIMALGAYLAIPLLNVAFLIFLEINQPEV
ncbi:type II secretion system F family protein [Candidatus Woesearchaeota archaeon]|nr:type II secretion system F family protein [Candidatus Woesearchaeota archaeon]